MSDESKKALEGKTEQLLGGPLKHVRAAALVAALVPLASVVATPASAQGCPAGQSGGICGTVFVDTNHTGIQSGGGVFAGAMVTVTDTTIGSTTTVLTNSAGFFTAMVGNGGDNVTVSVTIPTGYQVSPVPSSCPAASVCNNGTQSGPISVAMGQNAGFGGNPLNFGFVQSAATNPGTGTPGFWKNHPSAWPAAIIANGITIGGINYSQSAAIMWLGSQGADKTTTMFAQLVSAELNLLIGNDGTCVNSTIAAADAWMALHPVGSNVHGSDPAWTVGQPLEQTLDAYNNGLLCAPHRQ